MPKTKLIIAARASNLAQAQVKEVCQLFPNTTFKIINIQSLGDKNKKLSLLDPAVPQDFFTRELDIALLNQTADLAIHSAKDLPWPLPQGLSVIALTKADTKDDVLVSKNNLKLRKLPKGSRVGTSSAQRQEQLLALRPDLKIVSVRGTIEERLQLNDSGKIDALIVAGCALQRLGLSKRIAEVLPFNPHPLQGHLAVVARSARADLKQLFAPIDIRNTFGKVYLVGATYVDHLTLKADQALKHADVIYYDDLVDVAILARYSVKKVYIGKRKEKHSVKQDQINELLYTAALQGQRVVRLKCGDPLIFARGGEEIQYLQERLIQVEVIPGLSSAQIAAADSLIPLTHRSMANKLSFLSGHTLDREEKETLVYFMAASKLTEVALKLQKQRFKPEQPVAIIQNAGSITEKIVITCLGKLKEVELSSPILLIVGNVVKQFQKTDKYLFLGLDPWTCPLNQSVVHYPLIEIEYLKLKKIELSQYDAVLFTSKNGVKSILDNYSVKNKKIIAIGKQTQKTIEDYGYKVNYLPRTADSVSLAELIKKHRFHKILYPTSQISDNALHQLKNVDVKVFYKTKFRKQPKVDLSMYAGLVFSSASTVQAYFKIYKNIPKHLQILVYGDFVAAELAKRGYISVQKIS